MASLLSWAGKAVKRVANTVNNDVVHPVERAAGAVAAPVVNTAQVPYSAARLAAANVTGNQQAANNARRAVGSDANNNIFSPVKPLGNLVAGSLYARSGALDRGANQAVNQAFHVGQIRYGNSPIAKAYSGELAGNAKQQIYGNELNQAHLTPTTSLAGLALRTGGAVASAASPLLYAAGGGAGAASKGIVPTLKVAGKFGAANAAATASGLAAQGAPAKSYVKPVLEAGALGAAAPLVGKAVKVASPVVAKGATKLAQENPAVTELQAKKQATLKAMDTAKPSMMKNLVANVNSLDNQIKAIKQRGGAGANLNDPNAKNAFTGKKINQPAPKPDNLPTENYNIGDKVRTVDGLAFVSSKLPNGEPVFQMEKIQPNVSSASQKPVTEENPSAVPKTSPRQVSVSPTLKNDQLKQPGSGILARNQVLPQEQSLPVQVRPQSAVNPYPNSTPKRGFVQSVNRSGEVSPTVAGRASGTYNVRSTDKLALKADQFASKDLGKATEAVSSSLAKKRGNISDSEVANAIAVAKKHDANKNYAQATDIYENLAKHLTAQGQSIQAASLLDRRTPEGLRYHITKVFKKAGVIPSKEVNDAIDAKMKDIRATKPGTPERILATKQLQKIVGDSLPSTVSDKAISFWKAGLLTGARTQSGNLLSNETFSVLHNLSNPLAAGLDKGISLVTGQRTKTLTGRGLTSGTVEGVKRGGTYLKTGIDERSTLTNKFDSHQTNFKHKSLNTYVNGVFRLMGAADRPHYYRQLQSSLNDLALADGKNQGLTGQALRYHTANFVKDPPKSAFQVATNEAEKSVLANDTVLSRAIGKLRQSAEDAESPLGKAVTEGSINLLMPFTKVPSAFISRVVDYTPVGAVKTIAGQISRKQFDQRALVTAISEATTGTGLMYLGSKLAQNGMLSGDYPTDQKEQQRWKAEGIQPNSIKVGGKWINMNYAGPLGLLFSAGGRIADTKNQGGNWAAQQAQAYAGMPKSLMQQSFLQGLSGATQAINEPGRYANNYVKSQTGSLIPTLIGDVATATDSQQRATNGPADAIKSRIPGARETLNPAQDVYGNSLPRKTGAVSTMINPLRPTTDLSNKNPVVQEVKRLHNVDPNNTDLQVTPTPISKTIQVEGKPLALNDKQRYNLQKTAGQTIQSNWDKLIQTPEYKAMSDIEKAKALSNLRTDSTTLAERGYVVNNGLGAYNKPLTKSLQNLATGDLSRYTNTATSTKTSAAKANKTRTARTRAAGGGRKSTGTGGRTAKAKTVSLASYLATVKSGTGTKIKTPSAPSFKAASSTVPKFKSVSLKQYRLQKSKIA